MLQIVKNQSDILNKLGIEALNPMQQAARETILSGAETVLLSPTGTGKTLAFLLPLVEELDASMREVQALILVPSRELALQIEGVVRQMGTGFKANAVYGGRSGYQDKIDLKHPASHPDWHAWTHRRPFTAQQFLNGENKDAGPGRIRQIARSGL